MARQDDRWKLAEWQRRLRRFEKAVLTVARFCARERVSAPRIARSMALRQRSSG
jgi:hypothetical protein